MWSWSSRQCTNVYCTLHVSLCITCIWHYIIYAMSQPYCSYGRWTTCKALTAPKHHCTTCFLYMLCGLIAMFHFSIYQTFHFSLYCCNYEPCIRLQCCVLMPACVFNCNVPQVLMSACVYMCHPAIWPSHCIFMVSFMLDR
jgi:hypothetical protein